MMRRLAIQARLCRSVLKRAWPSMPSSSVAGGLPVSSPRTSKTFCPSSGIARGTICVTTFADANANGQREADEGPLAGVNVNLATGGVIIATHIIAFEGYSHVEFFPGNYNEYEADKKRRLGD